MGVRHGGRQKGAKNKKTLERLALLESSGITPLEVMINNMRFAWERVEELNLEITYDNKNEMITKIMEMRDKAHAYAESAVNYYHPKLASVAHTGPNGEGPVEANIKIDWVRK